jgi:hypothetical protein
MSYKAAERAWKELADREDLVGKKVVFDNRVGSGEEEWTLSKIVVDGGYVTIEAPELEKAHSENRAVTPHFKFKLDEERAPHQAGNTIFCDLDDLRQLRIAA